MTLALKADYYDAIVGGGSVSGLMAAREMSSRGLKVLVLEEDHEIGTPEHCGGVVSQKALESLGIIPRLKTVDNEIKSALIRSQSSSFEINSENQRVIVIDRRSFDKEIALQAQRNGAEINTRSSIISVCFEENQFKVKIKGGKVFGSKFFVDARGVGRLVNKGKRNIIPSGQFEVYAPWIMKDTIEVIFDSDLYPGFFAWIIPTGEGKGKVGVAGNNLNPNLSIERFLETRGKPYSIIRKIYAPIWISGYVKPFFNGKTVIVGDAAGQTKPTTAGGIYTGGMGGIYAGRAIAKSISEGDSTSNLEQYEDSWLDRFGGEFDKLLLFRRILERLDNRALDKIFSDVSKNTMEKISSTGDFDFHSFALKRFLNTRMTLYLMQTLMGNEYRKIVKDLSKI
ncbi:MAG TPA: NAD(P)/FAD-dependent oxidoreductase [Candidatus Nitrosocosmicus sp.]|nr:NAD(P)/FAD-dependent oxidoreductase [Candidatus Nitrosocosmicus sp.]